MPDDTGKPKGLRTYTASIELDPEQAAAVQAAARFFGLSMRPFLDLCLQRGIEWAQGMAGRLKRREIPCPSPRPSARRQNT